MTHMPFPLHPVDSHEAELLALQSCKALDPKLILEEADDITNDTSLIEGPRLTMPPVSSTIHHHCKRASSVRPFIHM